RRAGGGARARVGRRAVAALQALAQGRPRDAGRPRAWNADPDGARRPRAADALHHEKAIVIDDRVAYVGGIDLTTLAGNQWDTSEHPARGELGWHDAAVRIEGRLL